MSTLNRKNITSKPLRIDKKMAKDLELLANYSGYSQNDIIVRAVRHFMMENKKVFFRSIIEDNCMNEIKYRIETLHEEVKVTLGRLRVEITKTDNKNVYHCLSIIKNKFNDILFLDNQEVDITTQEWEYFKEYIIENAILYLDFDEDIMNKYFVERFSYE